jgi:hypothetical protein
MNCWIFQGSPDHFDVDQYLRRTRNVYWSVTRTKGADLGPPSSPQNPPKSKLLSLTRWARGCGGLRLAEKDFAYQVWRLVISR